MSSTTNDTTNLARGYKTAFACAAVLSTTAILIRHLTQTYQLPALVLAMWRDGFTALTVLFALGIFRRALLAVNRRDLYYLAAYGLVLAAFNALWTISVSLNGAAVSTVLAYCSAAFTALLGWWILKERLDWVKLLAVIISLGGCVLVSGAASAAAWSSNLTGILTGVISGLCFSFYSLMGRSASQRGLNPWTTLFYTFGFATIFLLILNLIPGQFITGTAARPAEIFWLGKSVVGWGILFLLAAGPTVFGFGLYNISLVYLPSSVVNLIATLEPVFTAIIAYFLLAERLNAPQLTGSAMILSGVVFLRLYDGWLANQLLKTSDTVTVIS